MKAILEKCEKEDFSYLSTVLDSYVSFTNDRKRKELLEKSDKCQKSKNELIQIVDEQIRYYGSSDFAYLKRMLFSDDGGVNSLEVVEDVCDKLEVKIKKGGSLEARLERLVTSVVEKELTNKTPEQLSKSFKNIGVVDDYGAYKEKWKSCNSSYSCSNLRSKNNFGYYRNNNS